MVADLSKRYGNLKNRAQDIKNHRFFDNINWKLMFEKKISPPYKPVIKGANDTTHFTEYPESDELSPAIKESDDPFMNW